MMTLEDKETTREPARNEPGSERDERADRYAALVWEFEATAQVLLARVNEVIEEVFFDHEIVRRADWRREVLFLAGELARYPWLLVNVTGSRVDRTLSLLYRAWAVGCGEVSRELRALAWDDGRRPLDLRISFVDEELAAVTASTTARVIYLGHALGWIEEG